MGIEGNIRFNSSVSVDFKTDGDLKDVNGVRGVFRSTIPAGLPNPSARIQGILKISFNIQVQDAAGRVQSAAQSIQPLAEKETPAKPSKMFEPQPAVKKILKQTPAAVKGIKFSVQGFDNNERAATQIRKELQQSRKVAVGPDGTIRKFDQKGLDDLEIHYFEVEGRPRFKIHLPEGATSYHAMETEPAIAPKFWIRSQVKQQQELLPGENEVVLESGRKFVFTVGENRHVKFE